MFIILSRWEVLQSRNAPLRRRLQHFEVPSLCTARRHPRVFEPSWERNPAPEVSVANSSELISQREIKNVRRAGRGLRACHSARNSSGFELPVAPLQRNRDVVVQLSKIAGPREGIS